MDRACPLSSLHGTKTVYWRDRGREEKQTEVGPRKHTISGQCMEIHVPIVPPKTFKTFKHYNYQETNWEFIHGSENLYTAQITAENASRFWLLQNFNIVYVHIPLVVRKLFGTNLFLFANVIKYFYEFSTFPRHKLHISLSVCFPVSFVCDK